MGFFLCHLRKGFLLFTSTCGNSIAFNEGNFPLAQLKAGEGMEHYAGSKLSFMFSETIPLKDFKSPAELNKKRGITHYKHGFNKFPIRPSYISQITVHVIWIILQIHLLIACCRFYSWLEHTGQRLHII